MSQPWSPPPPVVEEDDSEVKDTPAATAPTGTDPAIPEDEPIEPLSEEDEVEIELSVPVTLRLRPEPKNKRFETPYPVPENLVWRMGGEKFYGRFGWNWLKREDPEDVSRRIASDQVDVLWDLITSKDVQRVTSIFCRKGGVGKTATTCGLAAQFARITGLVTVGVDGNKSSGHLAKRFGMKVNNTADLDTIHGTLALAAYLKAVDDGDMQTYARLLQAVQRDRESDILIIGTDPPKNTDVTQELFRSGIENLIRFDGGKYNGVAHSVFIDTGGDFASPTNVGAAQVSNRFVFTSLASDNEGLDDLSETMALLGGGSDIKLTETGSVVPFQTKVNEALITIAGAKQEDLPRHAARFGVDEKKVFAYPLHDRVGSKSSTPVALSLVPWSAQVQINSILIALYDDNGTYTDPANLARAN